VSLTDTSLTPTPKAIRATSDARPCGVVIVTCRMSQRREISIRIAVGMLLHPTPCRVDHRMYILKRWLPVQFAPRLFRTGNEHGWVAFSSSDCASRDRPSGYLTGSIYYFQHCVSPAARAQIEDAAPFAQYLQREYVRLGNVDDVHIVPHTGAVRCRVIVAAALDIL